MVFALGSLILWFILGLILNNFVFATGMTIFIIVSFIVLVFISASGSSAPGTPSRYVNPKEEKIDYELKLEQNINDFKEEREKLLANYNFSSLQNNFLRNSNFEDMIYILNEYKRNREILQIWVGYIYYRCNNIECYVNAEFRNSNKREWRLYINKDEIVDRELVKIIDDFQNKYRVYENGIIYDALMHGKDIRHKRNEKLYNDCYIPIDNEFLCELINKCLGNDFFIVNGMLRNK